METFFYHFLPAMIYLCTIFFHIARKNVAIAVMYGVQSLAISLILVGLFFETGSFSMLVSAFLVFVIKVVLAPRFFIKSIRKHNLQFSASTYMNAPITVVIISFLTTFAFSDFFKPLTTLVVEHDKSLALSLAVLFISFLLIINRKGVLSQMIGILSLENGVLCFAILAGLEQSIILQIGVMFDIIVWLIIAMIFLSMIYTHFHTHDVTKMRSLHE